MRTRLVGQETPILGTHLAVSYRSLTYRTASYMALQSRETRCCRILIVSTANGRATLRSGFQMTRPIGPKGELVFWRILPRQGGPRTLSRRRDFAHDLISGDIGHQMYTLMANSLCAIVTVRSMEVDRTTELRGKYSAAKNFADSARKRELSAIFGSAPTLRSLRSIRRRILRWCSWCASWVYDARPAS